jgi:hypothetical protein
LAQERKCLSVLVTAYRPDVNRQNLLSESIGENPMFMSFQEYFLGSLDRADTERMVSEIGAWKDIHWSAEALEAVYELCGGHPLVTRFFASDACEQGERKQVDRVDVERTANAIRGGFYKHRMARYYKESVWDLLQADERAALEIVARGGLRGSQDGLDEALTHLEQFGVIRQQDGEMRIGATLFRSWLERSEPVWPKR